MNPHWEELTLTIWKKAISAVTSAALLASLLATSAFALVGPSATDADQTDFLNCVNAALVPDAAGVGVCQQVADGISTVGLAGDADSPAPGGFSTYITATGATIIAAGGQFTLAGGIVTAADGADINDLTDTITLRAPAAAGTATVSVFKITTATGIAALEGTMTITFTATSGLAVSEANSIVKFVGTGAVNCADTAVTAAGPKGLNPAAKLCVYVGNVNAQAVTTATVTAQIQPVGLVAVADSGAVAAPVANLQSVSTGANAIAGWYAFSVGGSGLAGVGTIGISVKLGDVTTTFAPKTFTFSDTLASLTVTQTKFAVAKSAAALATPYKIGTVAGKDAAGNAVACDPAWVATSGTVAILPNANLDVVNVAGVCEIHIIGAWTPATLGSTAITVAAGTIKAAPFTFYVSDVTATVTVAFGLTTIAAGGSTTITVEAKDAAGRPVADATGVALIVSAGAFTLNPPPATSNGKSVVTYLAPFNFGAVTALATVGDITKSGSANVGVPAAVVSLGSTASTLGVAPPGGSWSTSTKVAKVGEFITWRFAAGVANAGKTIGVFLQTKDANGVWSAPVRFSARVADSSGNAYFSWKGTSAMWVSIRGGLDDLRSSPPVQGRWQ
jgi:hypothetical protein